MVDVTQEELQWGSDLPGASCASFCTAVIGLPWQGTAPGDFVPGWLLAADVPSHVCHCCIPHRSGVVGMIGHGETLTAYSLV